MTKVWVDLGNGRKVFRKVPESRPERSGLACPSVIRDFAEPVQSMANGEWYTSKAALSRSHRASGNPHGQDFIELGNEDMKFEEFTPDPAQMRNDLKEAMHDVLTGNLPPEIAAIE